MDDQVNPDLDLAEYEDSDADGTITEIASPEEAAPTTQETPEESTSRRSRAVNKGQRTQPAQPSVNLHDLPEFRDVQANYERQLAEERRRAADLETRIKQREQEQISAQTQALEQAIADAADPDEQRRYVQQLAQLEATKNYNLWLEWDNHVRARVQEEGLNAADFDPRHYSGQAGAAQFERDVAAKKAAKLQSELETYKKAADPSAIQKMIDAAVAKKLQAAGMNVVDTATPATPVNAGASLARDIQLLNAGQMPRAEFIKRHGSK